MKDVTAPLEAIIAEQADEYPPAGDVPWLAWTNVAGENAKEHRSEVFTAHSWIEARNLAARAFGVLIEDVDAVPTEKLIQRWTALEVDRTFSRVA